MSFAINSVSNWRGFGV